MTWHRLLRTMGSVLLCALLLAGCAAPAPAAPSPTAPAAEPTAAPAAPTAEPTAAPDPTATPEPARDWAQDVWVQGGWMQQNTLASQGGTIYAYLGDAGALYAFDREAGTKAQALQQGSLGQQPLFYLQAQGGLLYAAGARGSGGFVWADPAAGESGGAGFYEDLRIGAAGADADALYLGAESGSGAGYGLYVAELEKGGGGLADRIALEAGEPLLFREGAGEISAVIPQEGALLLHEWSGAEAADGRTQRLVRLDLGTGEETVLAESIYNAWTPYIAGKYLVVQQADGALRPLLLDGSGAQGVEIALPGEAKTAEPAPAGALFALDWTNEESARTLSLIDPENGAVVRSAEVPAGWSGCLGTDGEFLYFWDSARPDEPSNLVAVSIETLDASEPFA
ncbi:MAG: hypothetical protein ACOX83_08720 [Candidatus Spyradocola sp.]|jgi:hypothetical protein